MFSRKHTFQGNKYNMKSTEVQTLGVMLQCTHYTCANAPLIDGLGLRMRIFRSDKNGRLRISRTMLEPL